MNKQSIILTTLLLMGINAFSQEEAEYTDVVYTIVAEGNDSPFKNAQVVCFNKYFNLEALPSKFQEKYGLAEKALFKKKMLIEIFYSDTVFEGYDKIELVRIQECDEDIIVEYNIVNEDTSNDDNVQSPFIVAQVPKSKKKIRFIANGVELGVGEDLYIDN